MIPDSLLGILWLYEQPLIIVALGVALILALGAAWSASGRKELLYACCVAFVLLVVGLIVEKLVVTDLIIEETHKWLVHHGNNQKYAVQILDGFVTEKFAQILFILPQDRIDAKKLVEKYLDHSLSYTDAMSVIIMKRYNIKKIFSFDSDFELMRGIERVP